MGIRSLGRRFGRKATIYRARLSKSALESANAEERYLFLNLAHVVNEVNALTKLVLWAANAPADHPVEAEGRVSWIMMTLVMLAGKLKEGHELLREKYYGTGIAKIYHNELAPDMRDRLRELNRYFSGPNLIADLRNKYAFHNTNTDLSSVLDDVSEELKLYLQMGGSANSLFYFSEMLFGHAVLRELNLDDGTVAFNELSDLLTGKALQFSHVAEYLLLEFIRRLGTNVWDGTAEKVDLRGLPRLNSIALSWFTDIGGIEQQDA
jgi:hypothetical protein